MRTRNLLSLLISSGLLLAVLFAPSQRTHAKELMGADSPAWSPDGHQIAYVVYQGQESALYIVDVDGTNRVKFAEDGVEPVWSPDGKRIAFNGLGGETSYVNIFDIESQQLTKLTIGYSAKWSPDGKHLAYLAGDELFITNADGSAPRKMITGPSMIVWGYAWSPDGKHLALSTEENTDGVTAFYLINPDGSGLQKFGTSTNDSTVSWSPDSSQLIFVGDCGGSFHNNICVVNADGSSLRALSSYRGALQPSWSPDGKQILFTTSGLYLMNADGTHLPLTLTGQDIHSRDNQPSWSPDGSHILFVRMYYPTADNDDRYVVRFEVNIMNADGSNLRHLPDGFGAF